MMPSRAMFTTPLLSENIPPKAVKRRGVVCRRVERKRAVQKATSRFMGAPPP
jgi:hypothetical protein